MLRRSILALGLTAAVAPTLAMAAARRGWKTIFDGRRLKGWSPIGEANWSLKDGAVEADKGAGGFLVSDETYGDFEARAEFWVSDDANSGVFIRCTNPLTISAGKTGNAYEVNIFDKRPDQTYATGGIVDVGKVSPVPKTGGRWNVMEIIAQGDVFTVSVNGVKTVDKARDDLHAHGRIALQYGSGVVKFRKVQVREL